MDPVDRIIAANSPARAEHLLIIDAPGLVEAGLGLAGRVSVWCDDVRDAGLVPADLLIDRMDAEALAGVDVVWMRLPKALGALDEYASLVAAYASAGVRVVAGGREKHLNRTMNQVLADHFTEVSASLGQQKSRALLASGPIAAPADWPRHKQVEVGGVTFDLWWHGATFAAGRIDAGTQLLIDHLDQVADADVYLDLGCGSGILARLLAPTIPEVLSHASPNTIPEVLSRSESLEGTTEVSRLALRAHTSTTVDPTLDPTIPEAPSPASPTTIPEVLSRSESLEGTTELSRLALRARTSTIVDPTIHAVDASRAAVWATDLTCAGTGVQTYWASDLASFVDDSIDVIVCNPPFHRGTAKDSGPTIDLFADAARVLGDGGEFWCVYNSHLPWKAHLSRLIGPTTVIAQNPQYTLTRSRRASTGSATGQSGSACCFRVF